jgi:hypothetical protein
MPFLPIVTDRNQLARAATERSEENEAFSGFLKTLDMAWLDEVVKPINEEVTSRVDCTQCGACCAQLLITLDDESIARLAAGLGTSENDFREKWLVSGIERVLMNTVPCPFLSECKCTVYAWRPNDCRDFPSLHKPGFQKRLFSTFMHYSMCPIVFNVIETLKTATGFKTAV